jgi:hypothetical protein
MVREFAHCTAARARTAQAAETVVCLGTALTYRTYPKKSLKCSNGSTFGVCEPQSSMIPQIRNFLIEHDTEPGEINRFISSREKPGTARSAQRAVMVDDIGNRAGQNTWIPRRPSMHRPELLNGWTQFVSGEHDIFFPLGYRE